MKSLYLTIAAVCMAATCLAVLAQSPKEPQADNARAGGGEDDEAAALERRIDNTVRARGEVISLQTADVVCQVPGESTVMELVEEGAP